MLQNESPDGLFFLHVCYVAAVAAFYRGCATFLCGAWPLRPRRGKLIPAPKLSRCRTGISLFDILLTGTHIKVPRAPICLYGSIRASLSKYFIAACSKAQLFRLKYYALYVVIISERLAGGYKPPLYKIELPLYRWLKLLWWYYDFRPCCRDDRMVFRWYALV